MQMQKEGEDDEWKDTRASNSRSFIEPKAPSVCVCVSSPIWNGGQSPLPKLGRRRDRLVSPYLFAYLFFSFFFLPLLLLFPFFPFFYFKRCITFYIPFVSFYDPTLQTYACLVSNMRITGWVTVFWPRFLFFFFFFPLHLFRSFFFFLSFFRGHRDERTAHQKIEKWNSPKCNITDLSSIFRHFVEAQIVDNIPTGEQEQKQKIEIVIFYKWNQKKKVTWTKKKKNKKKNVPGAD